MSPPRRLRATAAGLAGFLLSLPLHIAGISIALVSVQLALRLPADRPWPPTIQTAFVLSFALWQWVYLAPATLWLGRRHPALAFGLGASGAIGAAFAWAGTVTVIHGTSLAG